MRSLRRRLERLERPHRPQPATRESLVWLYGEEQADALVASGYAFPPFFWEDLLASIDGKTINSPLRSLASD